MKINGTSVRARASWRSVFGLALSGVALSAWGCDCSGEAPFKKLAPRIAVDPQELDFGEIPVGATSDLSLTVSNNGDDLLRVCVEAIADQPGGCTSITHIEPGDSPFSTTFETVADDGKWIVEKAASRDVVVHFTPPRQDSFSATLQLIHNAEGSTTSIPLNGSGVEPHVNFSTDLLDFGEVTVDQRKSLDLVLTNGTQFAQPVTIDPLMQSQIIFGTQDEQGHDTANGAAFSGVIPGNGTLTIKVWYQPPEEGMHSNTLHVHYCPSCNHDVAVKGTGVKPQFQLVPASLDFGTLNIMESKTMMFVVKNVGNSPLTTSDISLDQGTSNEYSVAPQAALPKVLAPMEELTVAVTYQGTNAGTDAGRVKVTTNAWDNPMTPTNDSVGYVALTAIASGPNINPIPPVVNFGTVGVNAPPVSKNLILENAGNAPLNITSVNLNSGTPEITLGGITPAVPTVVAPGSSITVVVRYGPTNAGQDMAAITVGSNDPGNPMLVVPVQGIGGVPTTCAISVAPAQLNFGLVERGRTVTLPVEVRNSGAQPCSVSALHLTGAPEFVLAMGSPTMFNIPAGSNQQIHVSFTPQSYAMFSSQLQFNSDDPAQAMVSVPITGSSAPSTVRVVPPQLDFAVVPVTCRSGARPVTVYNTGSSNVTITRVYLDPSTSPEFELQPFTTPANIAPGASAVISLRYHPADIGSDSGVLFIQTSVAPQPFAVPLVGNGQISPTVTDTFQQLPNPQVDVLMIVDNSNSMSDKQANLAANLTNFLTYATSQNIDFQIGATTTDVRDPSQSGRFYAPAPYNVRIIRPSTPNLVQVYQRNVQPGDLGSSDEQGLEAIYLALTDPVLNAENAGFLRIDAALAVILVSDEEDHSPRPVDFYVNFVKSLKSDPSKVSVNVIVGTTDPYCTDPSGASGEYSPRYIQAAQNTGGIAESICANWGQTLTNIGLNTFGLKRSFPLTAQPVPATISVTVDPDGSGPMPPAQVQSLSPGGMQRWTYNPGLNSVDFASGSVPPHNASISITYTVACLP